MPDATINLHFADAAGRDHVLHAVTSDGQGWHVHTRLGDGAFARHCHSWQGVERTLAWLRRHAHETAGAPETRRAPTIAAALACTILVSTAAWAQPATTDDDAVAAFTVATREYAITHRRLERDLGSFVITANPEEIARAIDRMAAAMRAVRPAARQGDFFTPAVAPLLRSRMAAALARSGLTRADVRIAELGEGIEPSSVTLRVGDAFPWMLATAMFPCVLAALPELPPELQYRIVGDTLVLIDVHASLVVDILPSAFGVVGS